MREEREKERRGVQSTLYPVQPNFLGHSTNQCGWQEEGLAKPGAQGTKSHSLGFNQDMQPERGRGQGGEEIRIRRERGRNEERRQVRVGMRTRESYPVSRYDMKEGILV